jgi:hypothetical protein
VKGQCQFGLPVYSCKRLPSLRGGQRREVTPWLSFSTAVLRTETVLVFRMISAEKRYPIITFRASIGGERSCERLQGGTERSKQGSYVKLAEQVWLLAAYLAGSGWIEAVNPSAYYPETPSASFRCFLAPELVNNGGVVV